MKVAERKIAWFVRVITGAILVILTVTLPAIFFAVGWQSENIHLRTETEIYARQVTHLINRNPDMWKYDLIRFEGIFSILLMKDDPEYGRILDADGNVILRKGRDLPWPVMTRMHPLMDSGQVVGSLELSRSLRPLILETAVLALVGSAMGLLLYFLIGLYPLAALRNALDLLSREKERAQVTLRSIGDGVITTDPENRVVSVSRAAETMTGWLQGEAAGKPIGEVFRREEGALVDRDGFRRAIESAASPILDEKGGSLGTVHVFRDVTEKARAAAEALKSQKLESLGILAGGIAHEIRNPLSGINIGISSVEHACGKSDALEPEVREKILVSLEKMKAAAAKISSVVRRVMDFSRPSPPHMEMADLNKVVEEAIQISSSTLRKRGIAVSKDLSPDLPVCRVDPQLIEQVIVNLITNAYQAMEKTDGPKRLDISSSVLEDRIVIRVSDSGPGVPASLRGRIFDPFFTTRKDGSGIGLSFSHRIIDDHGGALRIDANRWGGAEFRIELPRTGGGIPS